MDIREELKKFSQAFEIRINKEGEEYWCLKARQKNKYSDLLRDIHSTEMLPDDYRYSMISKISDELVHNLPWQDIGTIEEFTEKAEELRHECVDGLVDIGAETLLLWAASHSHRVQMIDEASKIYGRPDNLVRQLRVGQYHEIDAIYSRFIYFFAEFCKE